MELFPEDPSQSRWRDFQAFAEEFNPQFGIRQVVTDERDRIFNDFPIFDSVFRSAGSGENFHDDSCPGSNLKRSGPGKRFQPLEQFRRVRVLGKLKFWIVVGVKNDICQQSGETEPSEDAFIGDDSVPDIFSIGVIMKIVRTGENPIGPLVKFQCAGKDPGRIRKTGLKFHFSE